MRSFTHKLLLASIALLALGGIRAHAVDCYTAGFNCTNEDTQIKGSRPPSFGTDSGAANAYVLTTVAPLGPTLRTGSKFIFFAAHANTSASTLNVDSTGALPIKKSVSTALASGDILLNGLVEVVYDGTNFQCLSCGGGSFSSISGTLSCSQLPALTGDVTTSSCAATVARLQGRNVASTAPTNGYVLTWVAANNDWEPAAASGGGGFAGVNVQTSNYTLLSGDNGKLIVMNCSSACTVTMNGSPTSTYWGWIISIGSTTPTVSLNSTTFNGSASVPALNKYRPLEFWSDGTNYYGKTPLIAGTGITFTAGSNGLTVALTSSSITVAGTTCTLGSSCSLSTTINGTVCSVGSSCTISGGGGGGVASPGPDYGYLQCTLFEVTGTNYTSRSCASVVNETVGDYLLATCNVYTASATPTLSFSNTHGDTWTTLANYYSSQTGYQTYVFKAVTGSSGSDTFTCNISATNAYWTVTVQKLNNVTGLDTSSTYQDTVVGSAAGPFQNISSKITTTHTNELGFFFQNASGAGNQTPICLNGSLAWSSTAAVYLCTQKLAATGDYLLSTMRSNNNGYAVVVFSLY